MRRGENAHRRLIGVLVGDLAIDVEQVSVTLLDDRLAEALDRLREIQVHTQTTLAHAAPLLAHLPGRPAGNVARRQVAVSRVFPFQVIIALVFRNLLGGGDRRASSGTQTPPSFRSDSDINVSLDW